MAQIPSVKKIRPKLRRRHKLRVAAYCRVSSFLGQYTSLENQITAYIRMLNSNINWEYAGIYFDVKSGRSMRRTGLQTLLDKCEAGKVDLVIMKSISRFSRNTLDILNTIRYLTSIGVDVFFEKENIHTLTSEGELYLSICSAIAQNESHEMSENIKWGIERSLSNPESKFYNRPCFGYRRSYDGSTLEVVESEAETVKLIYNLKKSGLGYKRIIRELKRLGIPSPKGKPEWSMSTLQRILSNEKYFGEAIYYKTYNDEYPGICRHNNKGSHIKYHAHDHHVPIIEEKDSR